MPSAIFSGITAVLPAPLFWFSLAACFKSSRFNSCTSPFAPVLYCIALLEIILMAVTISPSFTELKLLIQSLAIVNWDVSSNACSASLPVAIACTICTRALSSVILSLISRSTSRVLKLSIVTGRSLAKSHFASSVAVCKPSPAISIISSICPFSDSHISLSYTDKS